MRHYAFPDTRVASKQQNAGALPCVCPTAAVAAAARSTKASWRALASTSKPEAGEAAAVQRDTTWASRASWLSLPCTHQAAALIEEEDKKKKKTNKREKKRKKRKGEGGGEEE